MHTPPIGLAILTDPLILVLPGPPLAQSVAECECGCSRQTRLFSLWKDAKWRGWIGVADGVRATKTLSDRHGLDVGLGIGDEQAGLGQPREAVFHHESKLFVARFDRLWRSFSVLRLGLDRDA